MNARYARLRRAPRKPMSLRLPQPQRAYCFLKYRRLSSLRGSRSKGRLDSLLHIFGQVSSSLRS